MKSITYGPEPKIPSCKITGRLIPAYDFLPRLQKLCLSLGFNHPIILKTGQLALPDENNRNVESMSVIETLAEIQGPDTIVVQSTKVPYEKHWGGYSGFPAQYSLARKGAKTEETPSDFILPYLQQYQLAQNQIHIRTDNSDRVLITLPDFFVFPQKDPSERNLRVNIEKFVESDAAGHYVPLHCSGGLLSFVVAGQLAKTINDGDFQRKTGGSLPIGKHLSSEMFSFIESSGSHCSSFADLLLPIMPWIVAHKTPHLAATLVLLQHNFERKREMFAATGTNDLRNLLCVAGLDIDMRGFRGRTERCFVPWQACWKRHGHCYGDIYPLLQDDLYVALMNYSIEGGSPEV